MRTLEKLYERIIAVEKIIAECDLEEDNSMDSIDELAPAKKAKVDDVAQVKPASGGGGTSLIGGLLGFGSSSSSSADNK